MEEQNISPLPKRAEEEESLLSFPEAIKAVAEGKRITKQEWDSKNTFGFLSEDGHLKINLPDKVSDWIISDGDLKGTDWIVLEDSN